MKAFSLIQTLIFTSATEDKLETATIVLDKLKAMKAIKGMPFFTIRRAIKLQEAVIKDLSKKN